MSDHREPLDPLRPEDNADGFARPDAVNRSNDARSPADASPADASPDDATPDRGSEPLYQPPNPADLREAPPQSPECARIRGMLRDFVDRDLGPVQHREVENHVHACRPCALALARSEYELFRLRTGILSGWEAVGPRPGFPRRVVGRLLLETSTDRRIAGRRAGVVGSEAVAPDSGPTAHGLSNAPANSAASAAVPGAAGGAASTRGVGSVGRRALQFLDRRSVLAASVIGAMVCAVAIGLALQGATELASVVRLSVVGAKRAWLDAGLDRHRVQAGDGLGDGAVLVVDPGGLADVQWHDADMTGEQPAAALQVMGEGELRLQDGLPQLVHGSMQVHSQREMSVLLGDGTRVLLGAGDYHISATEQSSAFDNLAAATAPLAVRVEVLDGASATLRVEGARDVQIGVGQLGRYGSAFSGVAVENVPSGHIGPVRTAPPNSTPPVPTPDVSGLVVDSRHGPVWGSLVTMHYLDRNGALAVVPHPLQTDEAGVYELRVDGSVRAGFALMEVQPPANRSLAATVRDCYPLSMTASGYTTPDIQLAAAASLLGEVTDLAHRPIQGAVVVPCLYDEVLGLVSPWGEQIVADLSGAFRLEGLPTSLPVHQCLGLLVFHSDFEVAFQPIPQPGSIAASIAPVRVELTALHTVSIQGLPAETPCDIYEELASMPVQGLGLRHHAVQSSADGRIDSLQVGAGALWLRSGTGTWPSLRRIELPAGTSDGPLVVDAVSVPHRSVFRGSVAGNNLPMPMRVLASGVNQGLLLLPQQRHDRFEPRTSAATFAVVDGPDGSNSHLPEVQVFALKSLPSGGTQARFVGLQSSAEVTRAFDADETEVVAIGLGSSVWSDTASLGRRLPLLAAGSLEYLPANLPQNGNLLVTIRPVTAGASGARPPMYRFVSQSDWVARGLPPGTYELFDGVAMLQRVTIRAGEATHVN